MKIKYIIVLLSLIGLASCKKESNDKNIGESYSFPLTIGKQWRYKTEIHIVENPGPIYHDSYIDSYWEAEKDTTINGTLCTKILQIDSNYDGSVRSHYSYYANKTNGLYCLAIYNSGSLFMLRNISLENINSIRKSGLSITSSLAFDSLYIYDQAYHLLNYPINMNEVWNSLEFNLAVPNVIKRKWIGYQTITINNKNYNCMQLKVYFDEDNDNVPDTNNPIINQYFNTKGLIKEEWNQDLLSINGEKGTLVRTTLLEE